MRILRFSTIKYLATDHLDFDSRFLYHSNYILINLYTNRQKNKNHATLKSE